MMPQGDLDDQLLSDGKDASRKTSCICVEHHDLMPPSDRPCASIGCENMVHMMRTRYLSMIVVLVKDV